MTQILVVDEDFDLQRLLRIKLGNAGYAVLRARDGAEALSVVAEQRPEVVITELVLPDQGGTELLAQLAMADPAPLVLVLSRLNSGAGDNNHPLDVCFGAAPMRVSEGCRHLSHVLPVPPSLTPCAGPLPHPVSSSHFDGGAAEPSCP